MDELNDYYDNDYLYVSEQNNEEDDGFCDIDINDVQDEEKLLMKNIDVVLKEK